MVHTVRAAPADSLARMPVVAVPVVAVPASIGHGDSFGSASAVLTMVNSWSPGAGIANISNGFGDEPCPLLMAIIFCATFATAG